MRISILLTKNNGETWEGSPHRNVVVPDNLTARDVNHLPYNLSITAAEALDELALEKRQEEATNIHITPAEAAVIHNLLEKLRRVAGLVD